VDRTARRGSTGAGTTPEIAPGTSAPSILLLFSDTGGGHRAAARALTAALHELEPQARVDWFDPLLGQGPPTVRRIVALYPTIIKRARPAWGAIYHSSNTRPAFAMLRTTLGGQVRRALVRRLRKLDPDLVISVHPLVNHVAADAIRAAGRRRPLATVVTDLIDLHLGWANPRADLVVVPTVEAHEAMLRRGLRPERVRRLGLPVDLRFRPAAPGEKARLRRELGIEVGTPTLLVSAGGEGAGNLLRQVRALAWRHHPWQVIAVCGRNERLRRRLARLHFGTPTVVLGFVDSMPELMRAADVAVGKAGPGVIAEALATGVPLILTSYLPGQETPNVRFVVESGVGLYADKPDTLREAVERLLEAHRSELDQMAKRAADIARPGAALDVARACLDLIPARRSTGAQSAASQARR
jgi:1,2-diacylglycerol 3-beta-galactosyltransferase